MRDAEQILRGVLGGDGRREGLRDVGGGERVRGDTRQTTEDTRNNKATRARKTGVTTTGGKRL